MKSSVLWGLVGLNAILTFMFIGHAGRLSAASADTRHAGDYLMIPGAVTDGTADVVYIIDTGNGRIGAIGYDDVNRQLQGLPSVNLDAVFNASGPDDLK